MPAIHELADTWNAGATTFVGIGIDVTDTASAADSSLLLLEVGGTRKTEIAKTGTQYIYNTYTDASNYGRAKVGFESGTFVIATENAGTGAAGTIRIDAGAGSLVLRQNTADRVTLNGALLYPSNDGGASLGFSARKWSALWVSGVVNLGTGLPTADPGVAGQVWTDGGTLKISAG